MPDEGNAADLSHFIRKVFKKYPNISSYRTLQRHFEELFESDFRPEVDQIDYMRKQQKSDIYRRQCKTFNKRRTMISNDFNSFKFGYGGKADADELSDGDEDGAEPNDNGMFNSNREDEDYFKGALANFEFAC